MRLLASVALVALVYLVAASAAHAQDIEPRKWSNTPVGVNFLILGYAYTQGGISFDPSLPINNPHLETNSGGLGFARSLDLWGYSGKFDVFVPYTWLSGSADFLGRPVQRTVNGFGDPEFELSVNLYGAPAMGIKDFASYKQDWIVGVALKVSAPSGQYDDTRRVNIATHRWFFRPSLGVSKAIGRWTLESTAAATFYTDNTDFYGGTTRSQAPLYSIQWHVIRSFRYGIWASVDATYFVGGRTTINGTESNDQWDGEQRSATELARRRYACAPDQRTQFDQTLRQRLHNHIAGWAVHKEMRELRAAQSVAFTNAPTRISYRKLEDIFCQIDRNSRRVHLLGSFWKGFSCNTNFSLAH